MCRWQVKDKDAEVVHGVIANHHPFFTSRPLWRLWELRLPVLHRLVQLGGGGGGGSNKLQRFKAHHPPTFMGGGDLMVADHWFRETEKILEVMETTSDAINIRLAAFQLEGESQVWWD